MNEITYARHEQFTAYVNHIATEENMRVFASKGQHIYLAKSIQSVKDGKLNFFFKLYHAIAKRICKYIQ